jgi:murein L,D-transpeptidase YafK
MILILYLSLMIVDCQGISEKEYFSQTVISYNNKGGRASSQIPSNNPSKLINYSIPLLHILDSLHINANQLSVLISKSEYTLSLRKDTCIIKSYPVVFGFNPVDDKLREGDGCTPEGNFRMISKYPHRSWTYFIWINYPNEESWRKHNRAMQEGIIPFGSEIGSQVGIHGIPLGNDVAIDQRSNWTLGCISLKNSDIREIYTIINTETEIKIIK